MFIELFGALHNERQRSDKDHASDGCGGNERQAIPQGSKRQVHTGFLLATVLYPSARR